MLAKDMTRGNPLQQILFFALPVMLTNICQQCYRIADAAVVGRCLGDTALGAVGGASEHLRVGLPSGFQTLVVALGSLIVQYAVNDFDDVAVSGISSVSPLLGLVYMPLFALHAALTTFCSQNFGARNLRRIIVGARRTALLVVIYTLSATALVFLCAPFLATLFLGGNADPDVVWHGVRFMRLLSPFFVVLGVIFLTYPPLVGMGYTMLSFWGGIVELACRVTGALLLTKFIGFNGACLSHPLAWFGSAVLGTICYVYIIRKLKREGIPARLERATA